MQGVSRLLDSTSRLGVLLGWCNRGQGGQSVTGGEELHGRGYSPAAASGQNSGVARVGGSIAGLEKLPGVEAEPLRGLAGTGVQRCSETTAVQGSTRWSKAGVALGFGASATG
jgi:hypothetical protein